MATVKNFSLEGLSNLVQFGKRGLKLLSNTSGEYISFTSADGNSLVQVHGANATVADAFITKGQFDAATQAVTQFVSTELEHNIGTTTLFEVAANSMIYSVAVDVVDPWVNASSNTSIVVGDAADADRFFTANEADFTESAQYLSSYQHIYNSNANITATINAGGATSGTTRVTVCVVVENLTVKNYGTVTDLGSV